MNSAISNLQSEIQKMMAQANDPQQNLEKPQEIKMNMLKEINAFIQILADLKKHQGASAPTSIDNWLVTCNKYLKNIQTDYFQVMVVGEFNRGKSTLINAFLRELVVDTDSTECTAILARLFYNPKPIAQVHYKNKSVDNLTLPEFQTKFSLKNKDVKDSKVLAAFSNISYANIMHPAPFLQKSKIVLIDSPGLNANAEREAMTTGFIGQAQAVLFLLTVEQQVTHNESHYIQKYFERFYKNAVKLPPIFFIINKWDTVGLSIDPDDKDYPTLFAQEQEKQKKEFLKRLKDTMGLSDELTAQLWKKRVFPIAAQKVLFAERKNADGSEKLNKADLIAQSGITDLEQALSHFFVTERLFAQVTPVINDLIRIQREVMLYMDGRSKALVLSVQDLEKRMNDSKSLFESATQHLKNILHLIQASKSETATFGVNEFDYFMNTTLLQKYNHHFKIILDEIPLEMQFNPKAMMNDYMEKAKTAFEKWLNHEIRAWNTQLEHRLKSNLADLEKDIQKEWYAYMALRVQINKILEIDRSEIGIEVKNEVQAAVLPIDWLKAMVPVFQIGMIVKTIGGALLATLLAKMGLLTLFGPIALIAIAVGGKAGIKYILNQEIFKGIRQSLGDNIKQMSKDNRGSIAQEMNKLFLAVEQQTMDLQADVHGIQQDYHRLLLDKKATEGNAQAEWKLLGGYAAKINDNLGALQRITQTMV